MATADYGIDPLFEIRTERSGIIVAANLAARGFYRLDNIDENDIHIADVLPRRHGLSRDTVMEIYHKFDAPEVVAAALQDGLSLAVREGDVTWEYRPPHKRDRSWWLTLQELPIPTFLVTLSGLIEAASVQAEKLLAGREMHNMGLLFENFGKPLLYWLDEVHRSRASQSGFVKLVGASRHYQLHISISPDPTLLLVFLQDITEMKLLEQQFLQSQKMQAIGQLAGGVAHDFNNLLTAISGHTDLLLLSHPEGDPSYQDLQQIHHNSQRAAALVRQLLAFSRKQTLQMTRIDMPKAFENMKVLLKTLIGERAKLTINVAPDVRPLYSDAQQFEQAIVNLVVNARDAIGQGGHIRIFVNNLFLNKSLTRDNVRVEPGAYIEIRVTDTGSGIAPDVLPEIFAPFFSTKAIGEGTGLGLSMVYGYVKQSGGYIFAESTLGKGASFTLLFAIRPGHPPSEATAPPQPIERQMPSHHHILLVEDELPVRLFAARALRSAGHSVREADHSEAALSLLSETKETFSLMITDVIMPGSDDISWVAAAHALHPDLPVIFVSGYPEETFDLQRQQLPHSRFLPKPYSLSALLDVVAQTNKSS